MRTLLTLSAFGLFYLLGWSLSILYIFGALAAFVYLLTNIEQMRTRRILSKGQDASAWLFLGWIVGGLLLAIAWPVTMVFVDILFTLSWSGRFYWS